jgi:hypothetical protein
VTAAPNNRLGPTQARASGRELAASEPVPSPAHVWVCTHEHRHGLDAWAAASEEAAYASFAETVRQFWHEAADTDRALRDGDRPPFPEKAPTEDREAVERYLEAMGDAPGPEFYSIERQEILGS